MHENNHEITYTYYHNKHYSSYSSVNKADQTQIHVHNDGLTEDKTDSMQIGLIFTNNVYR